MESFITSCTRLATQHMNTQQQEHIIIVTHREGIKSMMQLAGLKRASIPYCGLCKFQYINDDVEEVWVPYTENENDSISKNKNSESNKGRKCEEGSDNESSSSTVSTSTTVNTKISSTVST